MIYRHTIRTTAPTVSRVPPAANRARSTDDISESAATVGAVVGAADGAVVGALVGAVVGAVDRLEQG